MRWQLIRKLGDIKNKKVKHPAEMTTQEWLEKELDEFEEAYNLATRADVGLFAGNLINRVRRDMEAERIQEMTRFAEMMKLLDQE